MMNLQMTLPDMEAVEKATEKKKKKPILTMAEAWKHIGSMKNSDSDKKKLREVYDAFANNEIGREIGSENKTFTKAECMRLWRVLQVQQREAKLEEMVKNTPDNYILAMSEETLFNMREDLINEPIITVDTETKGLDLYMKDYIVGVSLTAPLADKHWYIPLRHDEANSVHDAWYYLECILNHDNDKVFANATFDLHQFASEGLQVNGKIHDVLEMMKVLNENEMSYRLKDLATKYLKLPSDTFDTLFGKDCKFNTVALKYARYYACKDTHVTWLLYQFCMKHLSAQPKLLKYYEEVEQPLIRVVWEMEREGFYVDLNMADKASEKLGQEVDELQTYLLSQLGDINLDSPLQLLPALQALGIDVDSTGKKVLKPLRTAFPIIDKLLEYKEKHKLNKDFISKVREFIQPDGKLHGSFKQNGARTGRFSSVKPNLQQIPPYARSMYIVDENSLILGLDFSAQEPRQLAAYTQEPALIENYRKGRDLYATTASEFYGKPYEECYKNADGSDTKERKNFKIVILAIMYGMGAKTLGQSLGIPTKEAQAIIDKFYAQFTKVGEFVKENTRTACKNGWVEISDGRKRRVPHMKGENPKRAYDTITTNARVQGGAAIQTKKCMVAGDELCKDLSEGSRSFALLACVHDELLFRVPKDVTREEVAMFERVMTHTVILNNIPSATDGELGRCWGDMTPVKFFFKG